ncbi:hypothetical protein [Synechococcus sp. PCC 6312]|uniref:hypothetical protein n=1 Tax=Synechococcus sp. (strain ATCC 27167 / PCC 6312) TaxID=195253 RepID=UPI00029F11F7|nr:hypothetical protein [Synechococcus sp. PCC 6312]AFY60857.1 hypothetical protein Syn6312_1703 [Synechococcus sp. PCC 6312]
MSQIKVRPEVAQAYQSASVSQQEQIQVLLTLLLQQPQEENAQLLLHLMDYLSDQAGARGLTPELLAEILAEPDA